MKKKKTPETAKLNKRDKYSSKMLKMNFVRVHPHVHIDDKNALLAYAKKLREARIKDD